MGTNYRKFRVVGFGLLLVLTAISPMIAAEAATGFPDDGESAGTRSLDTAGEEYTNSIGMKLELIPAGKFMMGSEDGGDDEKPVHEVVISKPFYMGVYEVTQAQYNVVMSNNPAKFKGANRPVENVSWEDAIAFCKKLSAMEKAQYRLPTEAEWEYACRAGSTTKYYWGEQIDPNYCWYEGNSEETTHNVGEKKPNKFGLYDMSGNVFEWCADWYTKMYSPMKETDSTGSGRKTNLVSRRGGSWFSNTACCRSAFRGNLEPEDRYYETGFRVILIGRTN